MRGRWDLNWLLVPLLSVFAVAPLSHPGYFWGAHDGRHSVYFLVEFDRSFRDGVLYPRWMPDFNFGYGYPFFNIYPPGAFYLGEVLHLAGLDFVSATKLVFALGIVLSGLTMYLYARDLWGRAGGLVAAVAYMYIPYRLVDVYVRGAQAESLTFVFFPLLLWALDRLARSPGPRWLAVSALALAALVFSHFPLALLFLLFLPFYILGRQGFNLRQVVDRGHLRSYVWAGSALVAGIGLAAILLLPAVAEYSAVRTDQWAGGYYDYRDHFVEAFQLFSRAWGFGTSVKGPDDTMPFQLGVAPLVLAGLAVLWPRAGRAAPIGAGQDGGDGQDATPERLVAVFAGATIVAAVLMLEVSAPVWEALRLAAFAQFPWRLLTFPVLFLALLCGALVARLHPAEAPGEESADRSNLEALTLAVPVVAVLILGSYGYLAPQMMDPPEGPVSLGGLMRFEQSANEMTGMTAWATAPQPPGWSPLADVFASGKEVTEKVAREFLPPDAQVVTTRHTSVLDEVVVRAPTAFGLRFYTAYYPGWRASVDGVETPLAIWGDLGGMEVAVPAGEHQVVLRFGDTWPRQLGTALSVASLVLVAGCLAWRQGSRRTDARRDRRA